MEITPDGIPIEEATTTDLRRGGRGGHRFSPEALRIRMARKILFQYGGHMNPFEPSLEANLLAHMTLDPSSVSPRGGGGGGEGEGGGGKVGPAMGLEGTSPDFDAPPDDEGEEGEGEGEGEGIMVEDSEAPPPRPYENISFASPYDPGEISHASAMHQPCISHASLSLYIDLLVTLCGPDHVCALMKLEEGQRALRRNGKQAFREPPPRP